MNDGTLADWELREGSMATVVVRDGTYGLPVLHRPGCPSRPASNHPVFDHELCGFDLAHEVYLSQVGREFAGVDRTVDLCSRCTIKPRGTAGTAPALGTHCTMVNPGCPEDLCLLPYGHSGAFAGLHLTGTMPGSSPEPDPERVDQMGLVILAPRGTSQEELIRRGWAYQKDQDRRAAPTSKH